MNNGQGISFNTRLLWGVAAVSLIWLLVILLWRKSPFVLMYDDAFYYFTIARNLARGMGSTFDGLNPTNGFHPLWMGVCMVVYWLGYDDTQAARILLAIQGLAFSGALWLLALGVGMQVNEWRRLIEARPDLSSPALLAACTMAVIVAMAVCVLNPLTAFTFINGLESGLVVLLDCALLYLALRWRGDFVMQSTHRERLGTSLVLSFLFLARTDSAFLFGCLALWCVIRANHSSRCPCWLSVLQIFALPTLTLFAYLGANWIFFGSFMQVSGLVKQLPFKLGNALMFGVFSVIAVAWIYVGLKCIDRGYQSRRFPRLAGYIMSTPWYAAFCLLLIGYYGFLQSQQWLWYYGPVIIYLIGVYTMAMADFVESTLLELPLHGSPYVALFTVSGVLVLPMAIFMGYHLYQIMDPRAGATQLADKAAGEWISKYVSEEKVLGSWDAGVIGYYSKRRVINLDGLVNSHAYFEAMRQNKVGAFLRHEGLSMIVNHGDIVNGRDLIIENSLYDWFGQDVADKSSLVWMRPYQFKGTTVGRDGLRKGEREMAVFLYKLPADKIISQ